MNFSSFFDDLGDNLQTSAENLFSNYAETAAVKVIEKNVPFLVVGKNPTGNLTAAQIAAGQKGSNSQVSSIGQRSGVDSAGIKNGMGFSIQNSLLKLGPIGIIGIAIVGALIWRMRK